MKRALDFLASLIGLALTAVPLALIALAIWAEDRHNPFFQGLRVGQGGKNFRMLKFRTMIPDAWRNGVNSTEAGDRRITRVGALLRQAKLDELPQLWNVLQGEMSLVGPRPQVPAEVELYTSEERKMLRIRPGITDLASLVFADEAQILAGSADPDLLYNQIIRPWKSRLALLYADRGSLGSDVLILLLTLASAGSRKRALGGVQVLLQAWGADGLLLRVAARKEPLMAWPPPGSSRVVEHYPRRGAHA